MVGRRDSLQTAPHLHDRMWELDGFGDYMKHSFHSQSIVLRRGITFTQMARNLEKAQLLCNTHKKKCAREKGGLQRLNLFFFVLPPSKGECNFSILMGFFPLMGSSSFLQLRWSWSMALAFKSRGHSLAAGGCGSPARTIVMSIMVR